MKREGDSFYVTEKSYKGGTDTVATSSFLLYSEGNRMGIMFWILLNSTQTEIDAVKHVHVWCYLVTFWHRSKITILQVNERALYLYLEVEEDKFS